MNQNKRTKEMDIDPDLIQPGPVRSKPLTPKQMARIKAVQETFTEVDNASVDTWINDFQRDHNPGREIAMWELMAKAYRSFCSSRELSIQGKKEVYKVVTLRSMAPDDEVLRQLELNELSEADALEVMKVFNIYVAEERPEDG